MLDTSLNNRLASVKQRIARAEIKAKHKTGSVELLAVSKIKPIKMILDAFHAGQKSFAENYVQEGVQKIQYLEKHHPDIAKQITWHFIGSLQTNKTRLVTEHFDWIQSINREKIANRLSDQRPAHLPALNVCIEVNIDEESGKSGILPNEVENLCKMISTLPNLRFRGLMCIPAPTDNALIQEVTYQKMHDLFYKMKNLYPSIDTLSMGMSHDLESAILKGSSMVRIGQAIFGKREKVQ